ncbi:hypothetical protein FE257_003144 [Aspergillus nanangensis]|uniref:Protein-lysine N-methyltransferase EFM6 n=1 Tax=Aspergillus nanangensis TaxID=2582783 RepID=A0AAD4CBV0_ASPNN|nr:hypothetical protein FE257_003144 [Aspergillus nanangensis]
MPILFSADESIGIDEAFNINESLVPLRDLKSVTHSEVSFDGLLESPLLLKEDLKEGCGGQLWPAGMVLGKYLLQQHRFDLNNKSIVELGAGGGLVGLAIAHGCNVDPSSIIITDQRPMLPLMETNIKLNRLSPFVTTSVLDWGEPLPDAIPKYPSIILAADCAYFEPAFPLLMSTLKDLIGPESICYFCFKRRRRADMRIMKLAKKLFHVEEIDDDPNAETYRRENILLYAFRLKKLKNSTRD